MDQIEKLIKEENRKELERQVERLGFFTSNNFQNFAEKINEVNIKVSALINYLNINNIGRTEMFSELEQILLEKYKQEGILLDNGVVLRVDGEKVKDFKPLPVNCEERIHLCKAVCCRLKFNLSAEEIEKGEIKWDLGIPYQIRQRKNGYCYHIEGGKSCNNYENRPMVCRNYSCVEDKRIWINFEKMQLNEKWISENLKEKTIKIENVRMDTPGMENKIITGSSEEE